MRELLAEMENEPSIFKEKDWNKIESEARELSRTLDEQQISCKMNIPSHLITIMIS
jgi:hypothetical protein